MDWHLEHLGLAAQDPAALKEWYASVLGLEVLWENPPAFFLRFPGGPLLEIYRADSARPETARNSLAGWRHLALRIGQLEEARLWLSSRGVAFAEEPKPAGGGGRVLFFQDPEGNLLHLVERPERLPWS